MTTLMEAMRLALKVIEDDLYMSRPADNIKDALSTHKEAITALSDAIKQMESVEPVAWMIWTHGPVRVFMNKDEANMEFDRFNRLYPVPTRMLVPLYPRSQPAW